MKKITHLLIVASLALAGAALAQEPTPAESQAPGSKKQGPKKEQAAPKAPKSEKGPKAETPAMKEPTSNQAPATTPAMTKPETPAMTKPETPATTKPDRKSNKKNTAPATEPSTKTDLPATTSPATTAAPDVNATKNQSRKNKKDATSAPSTTPSTASSPAAATTPATATTPAMTPKSKVTSSPAAATTTASPAATTPAAATASTTPAATMTPAAATASTTPATSATASVAPSVSQSTTTNTAVKKVEPAKVQQIRQQHQSFRAQARPDRVPPVTFSAGFRLPGVEMWTGPQYEVYRSYHPERHDRGYYSSRYQRVELIAGGYYYFNNGYWYPAWGYDTGHEYYAYDAPIYVGKRSDPPDKVIADVQAVLQEMGYYKGEVDGLIGPLTREALTGYQRDNGMTVTAVIDEPTLESLNVG